ncbi:MAG TPA: ArsR family transcriptional regulator [Ktedonobacteraceae bacterium]|jgi:protein-tyrosine-phosphatase
MNETILQPPSILKLVAHEVRWTLLCRLARSDLRVQELGDLLALPQNLVSYHLRKLREGRLVTERRSSADERASYYSLDLGQFQTYYLAAASTLHPSIVPAPDTEERESRKQHQLRVLFLCTKNSARSQMAEALLRHLSQRRVEAYSAGSQPARAIHPLAWQVMERIGVDMSGAVPKHVDLFRGQHFDAIVTVCDRVREVCPVFPDGPERIHWSFPHPALEMGSEKTQYYAFEQTSVQLATRIRLLITLLEREKGSLS